MILQRLKNLWELSKWQPLPENPEERKEWLPKTIVSPGIVKKPNQSPFIPYIKITPAQEIINQGKTQ